jgi:hypothetical protein
VLKVVQEICGSCHSSDTTTKLCGNTNVLNNDKHLGDDAVIKNVYFDHNPPVELNGGSASVKGEFGTLTLNSDCSYS